MWKELFSKFTKELSTLNMGSLNLMCFISKAANNDHACFSSYNKLQCLKWCDAIWLLVKIYICVFTSFLSFHCNYEFSRLLTSRFLRL